MDLGQSPGAVGVEDREPQPVLSIRAVGGSPGCQKHKGRAYRRCGA